jgi:hypothetical protein
MPSVIKITLGPHRWRQIICIASSSLVNKWNYLDIPTIGRPFERPMVGIVRQRQAHPAVALCVWVTWGGRLAALTFQATAALRDARYRAKPPPAKPRSIIAQVEGSGAAAPIPATLISHPPLLSEKMSSFTPNDKKAAPPGTATVNGPSPGAKGVPTITPLLSVNVPIKAASQISGPVFVGSMEKLGNGSPDEPMPVRPTPLPKAPST